MIKLIAGLDIGNGYVKGLIKSEVSGVSEVDIPSSVALMTRPNYLPVSDNGVNEEIEDIFDRLDVSFNTSLIQDTYRRLFGKRSLTTTGNFYEFDVIGNRSKSEDELSKILVLGTLAGKALKEYYEINKSLPDPSGVLQVNVTCALALPIQEYTKYRANFKHGFEENVHTVTIHNFETPITVKIKFDAVSVLAEGASAQFAIVKKGEPLMNAMLNDIRARGLALDGITAGDVLSAKNVIGIDIGEGTVNFPVFSNGRFNTDASQTLNKGYGSVLNQTLTAMDEQGFNAGFNSRKQLADYLQAEPSPIKRNHYNKVNEYVDSEIRFFAEDVALKFGHVLAQVGAMTEVAYVYGGGASKVKEVLYPLLMDKVKEMSGMDAFPVLYLDSAYSRNLNREGLFIAAEHMVKLDEGKSVEKNGEELSKVEKKKEAKKGDK